MSDHLYSVRDVAERLGVHERTIRNYLRSGALRGHRIGKQYRIAAADLDAFAGRPLSQPSPGAGAAPEGTAPTRAEASIVIEIEPVSAEVRARLETLLITLPGIPSNTPLRVQSVVDEQRSRMKILATGDLDLITRLSETIRGVLG